MRILIAGAAGQLGRCLTEALAAHELVSLDHRALDVARLEDVRAAVTQHRPALVVNASAFNDVDGAESRIAEAYAVNALGPRNLALVTAERTIPIVHVSTDYVFDGATRRPYHEFDRTNPLSVYAASKLAGEEAIRATNHRHYIVRTAWLFWEHGNNFLRSMHALASRAELNVVNDQYGSPTYVPHLAEGIARLISTGAFGTYHLAGCGGTTRWEMVCELFRTLGIATIVRPVSRLAFPAAAERPVYSVLTTIQDPHLELPPWQEGLDRFARRLAEVVKHR